MLTKPRRASRWRCHGNLEMPHWFIDSFETKGRCGIEGGLGRPRALPVPEIPISPARPIMLSTGTAAISSRELAAPACLGMIER